MSAGLFLLTVVIILGVIVLLGMLLGWANTRPRGLTSAQRVELRELKNLVNRLDRLAVANQDVNPELSYQIRDEIRNHEMKELS